MEMQVSNITRTCYHHIQNIDKIRKNISIEDWKALVQATFTPCLDYANVMLYALQTTLFNRLQKIQSCAARLVSCTQYWDTSDGPASLASHKVQGMLQGPTVHFQSHTGHCSILHLWPDQLAATYQNLVLCIKISIDVDNVTYKDLWW